MATVTAMFRCAYLALGLMCLTAQGAAADAGTARMVAAAKTFLDSLNAQQKQKVLFSYDDQEQRVRWSNFPMSAVPRAGINLGSLTPAQRRAAMSLVGTALTPRGMEKVRNIMDGDDILKFNDLCPIERCKGGNRFGADLFFLSILGTPSDTAPWMLQFGGHHLALNITVAGGRGVLTPTLTGAQPALYPRNGRNVRPLGAENDKAVLLYNSLTAQQLSQATLPTRIADLVLGPGQDGKTIQPEGLKATAMTAQQRALLLDLISEWANIIYDGAARARMAEIKAGLEETWFAWSGPGNVTPGANIESYYRIQGPNLVIEFSPQTLDLSRDPLMHVHTIYRDPTNDYGRKLVSK